MRYGAPLFGFLLPFLLYWVSGGNFERGPGLAGTLWMAVVSAILIVLIERELNDPRA